MTAEQKKEWTVGGLLAALLLWLLWFLLRPHGQGADGQQSPQVVFPNSQLEPLTAPAINIIGTPPISMPGSCGCDACSSCPQSPYSIGTINQILANGVAVSNAIIGYGAATLQAIADQSRVTDPLVKVTVG